MKLAVVAVVAASVTAGCLSLEYEDGAPAGTAGASTAIAASALSANALSANALSANALSANALSASALSEGTLSDSGLVDTAGGVAVASYLVRCALSRDQRLVVPGESAVYELAGSLGMAPQWTARALTGEEKEWLSACMLAHVNALDESVPISLRGRMNHRVALHADRDEEREFDVYEATFYGDLFGHTPELYACWATRPEAARRRSADRLRRICSDAIDPAGVSACGFVALGSCRAVCRERDRRTRAFTACRDPGGTRYGSTLGVWLRGRSDRRGRDTGLLASPGEDWPALVGSPREPKKD